MKFSWFIALLCTTFGIMAQDGYQYHVPKDLNDGWPVKSIYESDLKAGPVISSMGTYVVRGKYNPDSYLIAKNGELVLEEYDTYSDSNTKHDLRSVTKSIIALLTGVAIEQGLFQLDDLVQNHLIELRDAKNVDLRKTKITIRHLLTMSSGLDCNDWDKKSKGQEDRIYKKKSWIQALADLPMVNEPGEASFYCTGGVIMLASILERSSGLSLQEYAQKHLFSPLDIKEVDWGHTNKKQVISAGKRLYMRSRDMARLGMLLLHDGQWKGQQVVPKSWITQLHQTKTAINNMDYSYWWWQISFPNNGKSVKATVATGNGGQYIMCFPEHDMVVVFTGSAFNSPEQQKPFGIINNYILPALR